MTTPPFADLHNHTTASDGDLTPEALIIKACESGIKVVGVTDHDTVDGIADALDAGKRHGIELIPGVEVSIRFKRPRFTGTLHLLCYFMPELLANETFTHDLSEVLGRGRGDELVKARVKEINTWFGPDGRSPLLSSPLTAPQITSLSPKASRRHFALALSEHHHITDPDVINAVIGNKSPAYLPSGIDLADAQAFINAYPILSVLAHPAAGSFPGKGHYREVLPPVEIVETLLPEFLQAGIRGIEVHYPGHAPEHRELMLAWAATHHLIVTGGSDCHDLLQRPPGIQGLTREEFSTFEKELRSLTHPNAG